MYKFRKKNSENVFSYHFKKIIVCYEKIGFNGCLATDGMLGC